MYSIPNLKYKTTLCTNWLQGTPCQKGLNCYFAHGQAQLRKIQENQHVIASRNQIYLQYQPNNNFKTIYCKFFAKGQCKLGVNCTFAHQKKEKRKILKKRHNQLPETIPQNLGYEAFSFNYLFNQFQNYPTQYYIPQMMQYSSNYMINYGQNEDHQYQQDTQQIQIMSKYNKRIEKQEGSTNQKQKNQIDKNEEQILNFEISNLTITS